MNFSNFLNDLSAGSGGTKNASVVGSAGEHLRGIGNKLPGGLAGGAVAGGLVAMLLGSKSARKTAANAAKYGGVAILGGMAYKAYKNWQHSSARSVGEPSAAEQNHAFQRSPSFNNYEKEALEHMNGHEPAKRFQLALVKAMIASARADGTIDVDEQRKISEAIEKMNLDSAAKSELLELFIKPILIEDFIGDLQTMEQKAEVYLASCLVIELDEEVEYAHLSNLSTALALPAGLEHQLRAQAAEAKAVAV